MFHGKATVTGVGSTGDAATTSILGKPTDRINIMALLSYNTSIQLRVCKVGKRQGGGGVTVFWDRQCRSRTWF